MVTHQSQNFEHIQLLNSPDLPPTPEQQNAEFEQLKEIAVELIDYKLNEKARSKQAN